MVFWDVVQCSLMEIDCCFRNAYCPHHHHPNGGSSTDLCNIGQFLRDYMMQHPTRQSSPYSPL
jgi:hypothetical protein